jgi:hypothetical protein
MENTIIDNSANEEEPQSKRPLGRPRRFPDVDPALPFKDYVKHYNKEYYLHNRYKHLIPKEEYKKFGRPKKHFIESYNITLNEDASFFCHICGSTFKNKPERHATTSLKCQLARAKLELQQLQSAA